MAVVGAGTGTAGGVPQAGAGELSPSSLAYAVAVFLPPKVVGEDQIIDLSQWGPLSSNARPVSRRAVVELAKISTDVERKYGR